MSVKDIPALGPLGAVEAGASLSSVSDVAATDGVGIVEQLAGVVEVAPTIAVPDAAAASAVEGLTGAAPSARAADPVTRLAEALDAAAISPEQLVEQLVDHAMTEPSSALLSEAERATLRDRIHSSLSDDPHLASLVRRLQR